MGFRITLAFATASSPKRTTEGLVRLHLPSGVCGCLHLGLKLWARILHVHAPEHRLMCFAPCAEALLSDAGCPAIVAPSNATKLYFTP